MFEDIIHQVTIGNGGSIWLELEQISFYYWVFSIARDDAAIQGEQNKDWNVIAIFGIKNNIQKWGETWNISEVDDRNN